MKKNVSYIFVLLLTSIIWGFAFVAQRKGMESLDPMTFNGIRFALGALFIGILANSRKNAATSHDFPLLPGIILFLAASLQQIGIVWTTAGNAGFITSLYVVFVPLLGLILGQSMQFRHYIAVMLSCIGIYFISVKQGFQFNIGDLIVLASAFFWALHVQVINKYSKKLNSLDLAFSQFAICAMASLIAGFIYLIWKQPAVFKHLTIFTSIYEASIPIIYGGLFSVGIAYTLQIVGQKRVEPTPAAIILCLESVFAMFGGWLLLKESVSLRMLIGALILFSAMILSTIDSKRMLLRN
jgi:drug/metabolite transporter (DMT)-like permease